MEWVKNFYKKHIMPTTVVNASYQVYDDGDWLNIKAKLVLYGKTAPELLNYEYWTREFSKNHYGKMCRNFVYHLEYYDFWGEFFKKIIDSISLILCLIIAIFCVSKI